MMMPLSIVNGHLLHSEFQCCHTSTCSYALIYVTLKFRELSDSNYPKSNLIHWRLISFQKKRNCFDLSL
jgi:hypothetical protein